MRFCFCHGVRVGQRSTSVLVRLSNESDELGHAPSSERWLLLIAAALLIGRTHRPQSPGQRNEQPSERGVQ